MCNRSPFVIFENGISLAKLWDLGQEIPHRSVREPKKSEIKGLWEEKVTRIVEPLWDTAEVYVPRRKKEEQLDAVLLPAIMLGFKQQTFPFSDQSLI